jgi:3-methyladenine DNA glycosylase AlkD
MSNPELTAQDLIAELFDKSDPLRATHAARFFKCGVGEYGDGDIFVGITMPTLRKVAKNYRGLPIAEIRKLLESPFHEYRMAGVVIMADIYKKSDKEKQKDLYELYLYGLRHNQINNWDLVDVSAPHVVGAHILEQGPDVLYRMALSENLWIRRTSIVSTFAFLRAGDAVPTIKIAELLLRDTHDLIHKAVGWLLREMGKRVSEELLTDFLDQHAHEMPRTMLRYSLEKLTPEQRNFYMT